MLRRVGIVTLAAIVALGALATGQESLYFLVFLTAVIILAAYLVARRGLVDLQAGSWLERGQATAGEVLTITYTLRNTAWLPKPWLEVTSPSTLPMAIPGRVVSLAPRTARTWAARVSLTERGQFRIDPMVVRTGDPLGLFESVASVGPGSGVLVYPRVEGLSGWRIPSSPLEGSESSAARGPHATPLVTSVRPYTPGDAFNRIHWRSSARHQELQVKEFDIEQTADLWIILDLDRARHAGSGPRATIETGVRAAASLAEHALAEGRNVGLEAHGLRRVTIGADRGPRQRHKIMGLLAVAQPDGRVPVGELLAQRAGRLRRGTVTVVITPSLDQGWIGGLGDYRRRGAPVVACIIDPTFTPMDVRSAGRPVPPPGADDATPSSSGPDAPLRALRALRHALEEHDVQTHMLLPDVPLGEQIRSAHPASRALVAR
ncbi:DUF58 domain-containing protein [soil metagenome]